jgi:hypothetical protein
MELPLESRWVLVALAMSLASCTTYGTDLISTSLAGTAGEGGAAGGAGVGGVPMGGGAGASGSGGGGGADGSGATTAEGGAPDMVPTKPYLTASIDAAPLEVDLTNEGALDWVHWGLPAASDSNHKTGVISQLLDFKPVGSKSPAAFGDGKTLFTWNDGEPTTTGSTIDGITWAGLHEGFELVVPAVATPRLARLYVGVFAGTGRIKASLSDPRATTKVDTPLVSPKQEWVLQVISLEYGGADVKDTKLDVTFSVEATVAPSAAVSITALSIATP